jgi:hypothetical protein
VTHPNLAIDGKQRLAIGSAFELDAANELRSRGLRVDRFGQALLPPDVREVLKTTNSLLRWLPDLIGWRPSMPRPFLVDAKTCLPNRRTENHSIELRVLLAAHFTDLPVFFVCDDYRAMAAEDVWPSGQIRPGCCNRCIELALEDPTGRRLPSHCAEHKARGWRGSGTPYVLIRRSVCRPVEEWFGPRRCITCDVPADQWEWDSGHQCPACKQADRQEGN